MVTIKKEKRNGKIILVARDEKGYIASWTYINEPEEKLRNRFKRNGSFKEGRYREEMAKVIEYRDYNKRSSNGSFQVVAEGYINGKKVSTRSEYDNRPYKAKKEILKDDFRRAVMSEYYGDSDPDITDDESDYILYGELPKDKDGNVKKDFSTTGLPRLRGYKEGVVRYKAKT